MEGVCEKRVTSYGVSKVSPYIYIYIYIYVCVCVCVCVYENSLTKPPIIERIFKKCEDRQTSKQLSKK
jgi:hypothetical protein